MIKAGFITEDGTAFNSQEEAERYAKFCLAKDKFLDAWVELDTNSQGLLNTADGYPFIDPSDTWFREKCYWVKDSLNPSIEEVLLYPAAIRGITIEEESIILYVTDYNGQSRSVELSEIFKKKENANKQLVKLLENRVKGLQERITQASSIDPC